MNVLTTPPSRFVNLPDYPFSENYLEVGKGLNMHYLDVGNPSNPVVLLLHGEPSWSYLYRKMIPALSREFRVIAPDLIGFGKSDKPAEQSSYSYQAHMGWLTSFVEQLELENILLFCQDWGGLLGLRLVGAKEHLFSMVVASNTVLPTGQVPMPESFLKWREFSQSSPDFDIGKVLDLGTVKALSDDVIAAYNAPFPSEEYKAGARIFPMLVPFEKDDPESIQNIKAWEKLSKWEKPFLTIFGEKDYIMKGAEKIFQQLIPGTKGQNHALLDAGHFIQEEKGEELAEMITAFYRKNV